MLPVMQYGLLAGLDGHPESSLQAPQFCVKYEAGKVHPAGNEDTTVLV